MPQATQHEPFYWWVDKSKIGSEGMEAILAFWPFFGLNFKFGRYVPPKFGISSLLLSSPEEFLLCFSCKINQVRS